MVISHPARQNGGQADLGIIAAKPATGSTALRGDILVADSNKPGDADGRVTLGDSWDAYGYGNPVLTVSLTGTQLDAVLEQQWQTQTKGTVKFAPLAMSGNEEYASDASRPVGDRIDPADVTIDGVALDPAKTYRVAALAYTVIGIQELHEPGPQQHRPRDVREVPEGPPDADPGTRSTA